MWDFGLGNFLHGVQFQIVCIVCAGSNVIMFYASIHRNESNSGFYTVMIVIV